MLWENLIVVIKFLRATVLSDTNTSFDKLALLWTYLIMCYTVLFQTQFMLLKRRSFKELPHTFMY